MLYYVAIQTVRKNGIMHEYYQKLIGRGMERIKALVAVARKLLRIVFAMVRDQSEFMANYANQRNQVIKEAA